MPLDPTARQVPPRSLGWVIFKIRGEPTQIRIPAAKNKWETKTDVADKRTLTFGGVRKRKYRLECGLTSFEF